jgi:hypothetical protein
MITYVPDPPPSPAESEQLDRSKTINKKIPIAKDPRRCPALPTIMPADNYKTKVVQSMLQEYCTSHIR